MATWPMFLEAALATVERMTDKTESVLAQSGHLAAGRALELLRGGAFDGQWVLDARRSTVRLATRSMWGLAPVTGAFRGISGQATISADGAVSGSITIAAATIDTHNAWRDRHLRSAAFLDSDKHPNITFAAEGVRPSDWRVIVTGALTVRGRTVHMSVDTTASVDDRGAIRLDAEVNVDRADLGLTWNWMGMASSDNTLVVHAVFTRR